MKVLVTGGAGYVGYSLVEELIKQEDVEQVVVYDNLQRYSNGFFYGPKWSDPTKIKVVIGNILDEYSLLKACSNIDVVYHLAAKVLRPFSDSFNHEFDHINNWGTACVASVVERVGRVQNIVYLSSASIYGPTSGIANEDTSPDPDSVYGLSKHNGEQHILQAKDVNKWIVRSGNIYGYNPCMRVDGVIHKMLFDAHHRGKISLHGSGDQLRSFTNLGTVIEALAQRRHVASNSPLVQNYVDHVASVNEIGSIIKGLYPDIDIMHLQQHISAKNIEIGSKYATSSDNTSSLQKVIEEIANQFKS